MTNPAAPTQSVQQGILQALYALFLGGIITAFLVIGMTTFYPTPDVNSDRIQVLEQQQSDLYRCDGKVECTLTPEDRVRERQIQDELDDLWSEQRDAEQDWTRNGGLILITAATILLALSLVRWDRAIVISNGLLLGGLFTMTGGMGMSIAGGEGLGRFLVITVALAITVGLGYLRFARRPVPAPRAAATAGEGVETAEVGLLEERVGALEARMADLRRALGG